MVLLGQVRSLRAMVGAARYFCEGVAIMLMGRLSSNGLDGPIGLAGALHER